MFEDVSTKIILKNNRLKVDIQVPSNDFKGTRFDRCGMIEQVTLDNIYTFCTKESLKPNRVSNGFGLCNEFGLEKAIGYEAIDIGEEFPKIGIGALEKDSYADYDFTYPYKIVDNRIDYIEEKQTVKFKSEQKQLNGYAYIYEKQIIIKDNYLIVDYLLRNTGVKLIGTTEYCHNFLAFNGISINQNYELVLNSELDFEYDQQIIQCKKNKINWLSQVEQVFYLATNQCNNLSGWCLIHKQMGVWVKESVKGAVCRFALWGDSHVVSPEMFVSIVIKPNEIKEWTRIYEFGKINEHI